MKILFLCFSVFSVAAVQAQEAVPKNISICYETFSLPLAMAAKLQREQLSDPELYERLVTAVRKETVKQETLTVLRCRSSQASTDEAISEQIYPTEFAPARSLNPAAPAPDAGPAGLKIPAIPKAFDTRNTGVTLEFEPTLSEDEKFVDLRIAPEHITAVGRTSSGQDIATAEMPVYESQRTNTSATVRINRPFLLSTMNRPPVSQVDPDSAKRVWFAFVTATISKP